MTVFAWGFFGILDPYPQATVTVTEGPLADLRLSMRELASPINLVILAVGVTNFGPTQATGAGNKRRPEARHRARTGFTTLRWKSALNLLKLYAPNH
jgi:hypothetical protein